MRIRTGKLATLYLCLLAPLVAPAFADVRTQIEYRDGGTLALDIAGVPLEVVLSRLDDHPGIEIKVLGLLSASLISLHAEGDLEDVLDRLLDGYSFVLDYSPSEMYKGERVANVYILSAAPEAAESMRSDADAAASDQVERNLSTRHTEISSRHSPTERAHIEAEAMMRNWNAAQDKADQAHKAFVEEQRRRREGVD